MKKYLPIIILVVIILSVGVWWKFDTLKVITVTTFEECIAAGNPAMESYPRQCRHENETFTEIIAGAFRVPQKQERTPTSADNAPEGSIHNLPVPDAVASVRTHIANELNINEGVVIIMTAYEKVWTNGCLDLTKENEFCTEALVPGYEVTAQAEGKQFIYHTNSDGTVLRQKI